jgi:hypothetical protein
MNAREHVEVASKADQGQKYACRRVSDIVPEGAPVNGQLRSPTWVWPAVVDGRNFETFLGGEGI